MNRVRPIAVGEIAGAGLLLRHEAGKPTKAESIARSLADDIVKGLLAPGTALDETLIAARYGVSRTPIREAIRQLTATGVLETRAHRGAVVRSFSEKELDDMFAVMADLEALCARGAALAMTAAEQNALGAILSASAPLVERDDHIGYGVLNEQFHEAIYAGAHNDYLAQITLETRAKIAPFRQAQFEASGRLAHSFAEHRRVLDAITGRAPTSAFEAMHAHIVVVRAAVDRVVEEQV